LRLGNLLLAVGLVVALMSFMGTPLAVQAAEKSPADLLADARKMYDAHNYQGALKRLQSIDRDALGFFDKGKFDALLGDTQKGVTGKAAHEKAFAEGKEALANKQYATAIAKLTLAAESEYLEADKAGPAKGLLRLARDGHDKGLQQARDLIDQAAADLKAGKQADARKKLQQVQAMNLNLAGADRKNLAELDRGLAVAKAEPKPKPKPAVEPKPKPAAKPAPKPVGETKVAQGKPAPAAKTIVAEDVAKPKPAKPAAVKPKPAKPAAVKPKPAKPAKPAGPTPSQRYAKAKTLYEARDYDAAKKELAGVKSEDLSFFDRLGYGRFEENVNSAIAGRAAALKSLAAGKKALANKKYLTAVKTLTPAAASRHLAKADYQDAQKTYQQATQAHGKAVTDAKNRMKQAQVALDDGNVTQARKLVDQIAATDVDLGWWTGMGFERIQNKVAAAQTVQVARAETSAGAAEPAKPEPKPEPAKPEPKPEPVKPTPKPAPKPVKPAPVKPAPVKPVPVVSMGDVVAQAHRAHAEEQIQLGQGALKQYEYQKARNHFARALELWPESKQAQQGLDEAMKLLAEREEPLGDVVRDLNNLERQRIIANVQGLLDDADRQVQKAERPEDYTEALRPLAKADRSIDVAPVLSLEERERLREEVHALRNQIKERRTALQTTREQQAALEADQREKARREADRRDREKKIAQLWERASELRKSMQFNESIEILDRLLAVDPNDERARRWREDMLYLDSQARQVNVRERREAGFVEAMIDAHEASIHPGEKVKGKTAYLRYPEPKTWKDLSEFRRAFTKAVSAEPKAVSETRRRLEERIDLDFEKTSLDNVLNYISEVQRGLNIVIDPDIATAGIDLSTRVVDLKVKQVSVESVLHLILGTDLGSRVEPGYILITTREKLQQNLPVVTYPVQDLVAQIPDFGGEAPRFEVGDVTQAAAQAAGGGGGAFGDLFGAGGAVGAEEGPAGPQELRDLIQRTVNNQSDPSVAAWADEGGPAAIEYMNGLLIVTQTRTGHEKVADLLEQLRRERAIMISVESRFCEVTDEFLQDITLDIDVAFTETGDEHWIPGAGTYVQDPGDVANPPYDTLPGIPADATFPAQASQPIIVSGTGSNGMGTATLLPVGGTVFGEQGWTANANQGGLVASGVFLDDIQVGFLLRAIQADVRSTTLQAPRVTLYNGQRSYISVSEVTTYVADIEPVVAEAAVGWDPTIGAIPVGVTLDVKATVSADRRYVQMDLRPQIADITGWDESVVTAAVPNLGIATATIDLPVVQVQDFKTTVSVPDNGTLLLGGTREFIEGEAETGVPVLSKVPILKRLFNNRATVRRANNLLIMMKPKILIQAEEEAKLGYDNF